MDCRFKVEINLVINEIGSFFLIFNILLELLDWLELFNCWGFFVNIVVFVLWDFKIC